MRYPRLARRLLHLGKRPFYLAYCLRRDDVLQMCSDEDLRCAKEITEISAVTAEDEAILCQDQTDIRQAGKDG
jgi:hypothetical protein